MLAAELFAATPAQYVTFASLMPGAGSDEPNRNKAMMPSVKSSFLRRSGVLNARMNAVSMRDPSSSAEPAYQRLPYRTRRRTHAASSFKGPPLERASLGCGLSVHYVVAYLSLTEQRDRSARCLDLLPGRSRNSVRAHAHRHGQ